MGDTDEAEEFAAVVALRAEVDDLHQCLARAEAALSKALTVASGAMDRERETALLRLINEASDAPALAQRVALVLRDWAHCEAVGIRWQKGDDFPYLEATGFSDSFVLAENKLCVCSDCGETLLDETGNPVLACMCGAVLRGRTDPSLPFFTSGGSFWTNSTTQLRASTTDLEPQARTRNRCCGEGYESVALIPLRVSDTVLGLIQLNDSQTDRFNPELIAKLERIAGILAARLAQYEAQAERDRLAAEAWRRAEELDIITAAIGDGLVVYSTTQEVLRTNAAAERILGFTREQFQLPYEERQVLADMRLLSGEALPRELAPSIRALQGETVEKLQVRARRTDGTEICLSITAAPVINAEGEIIAAVMTFRDVTQLRMAQQQAEEAALNAQRRADELDAIINSIPDGILIINHEGKALRSNAAFRAMTGYTEADLAQPPEAEHPQFDERDREGRPVPFEDRPTTRALRGESVAGLPLILFPDTDHEVIVNASSAPLRDASGEVTGAVIALTNITRTVHLQEQAQQQAAELEGIILAMRDAVVVYDRNGIIVRANRELLEEMPHLIGMSYAENTAQMKLRWPNGTALRPEETAAYRALHGEQVYNEEMLRMRSDGEDRWQLTSAAPLYRDGEIIGAVAHWRDITELRRIQAEREQIAETLTELIDAMPAGVLMCNPAGEFTLVNEYMRTMMGIRISGDARGPSTGYTLHHADGSQFAPEDLPLARALGHGERVDSIELVFRLQNGRDVFTLASARPLNSPDGQLLGAVVVIWDISELHQAQEQLRSHRDELEQLVMARTAELAESERRYRELVESANSAILYWHKDGILTFANAYAERLFGYAPGELIGKPVTVIVSPVLTSGLTPEELINAIQIHPQDFEANENENITKDGRSLWMSWANRVIRDAQGNVVGIMAIGLDRTEQHKAEEELKVHQEILRKLAAELALTEQRERKRIATWLHDDVAQILASAKMRLGSTKLMTSIEQGQQAYEDILGLLDQAIRATRNMAVEMSPPLVTERGLSEALKWTATRAHEQYGFTVSTEVDGVPRRLDLDIEMTMFQAVKELLSNVAKHAQASNVFIAVMYGPQYLEIKVADNGVGFDASAVEMTTTGGFGLTNIRERLAYMGGKLTIESTPGQGSTFTLWVPVPEHVEKASQS